MDRVRFRLEKPPPPKRDVKSLAELLPEIIESIEQPKDEAMTVLCGAWEKLVGPQVAQFSRPVDLRDRTLYVFVNHPGWISELERLKRPLLQKIQQHYRELEIRRLRFEYNAELGA